MRLRVCVCAEVEVCSFVVSVLKQHHGAKQRTSQHNMFIKGIGGHLHQGAVRHEIVHINYQQWL